MEAGFGLEPLTGKSRGDRGAGGGADAAEGEVGGGPGFCTACAGAEDGAADVVGADEGRDAAFDHGQRCSVKPDVFPDQRAGGLPRRENALPERFLILLDIRRCGFLDCRRRSGW